MESGSSTWVIQHGVITRLSYTLELPGIYCATLPRNTNKQFAFPKAFSSISTLHRAHKSWFLCSFSLSCKVRCKWLNVKQRNFSTCPKLHSPHPTLYSAFLLRSFVKHQHRYKPSPMTTNIKDWCTKTGLASFQRLQTFRWTSTQTEGDTFELVTCCTKARLMKSTLVRTLILMDPASQECPWQLHIPWING